MTIDAILDGVLEREGGFVDSSVDRGGATNFGITAAVLGEWRKLGRPAKVAEIKALTEDEARDIYAARYVAPFAAIADDGLRVALIDFGVNSGVREAIQTLQRVLGVVADGVLGSVTLSAIAAHGGGLVDALTVARIRFLLHLVELDPSQLTFFHGWVARACDVDVSEPL